MSFKTLILVGVAVATLSGAAARSADLIVSGNDGKFVGVHGAPTDPRPAPNDSLAVIDASVSPPVLKAVIQGLDHTIQGPPQSVAITPDGRLAFLGAPSSYDFAAKREKLETYLQVIDLEHGGAVSKVELGAHPNGLSVSPDGKLLLAACTDGTVKVLAIAGGEARLVDNLKVGDRRLASVVFTHDGAAALVSMRDEGGLSVLSISGGKVTLDDERVATGLGPFDMEISSDGRWAVVGNAGLSTLIGVRGRLAGDADTVTLVDVSHKPFRAVQHITVPATPEGVAISPDGRWIAVNALDGSSLPPANPGHKAVGQLVLFEIRNGVAVAAGSLPTGAIAQGVTFAKDSRTLFVQLNVEKAIAVFRIDGRRLKDTGQRIALAASPVSIASTPR